MSRNVCPLCGEASVVIRNDSLVVTEPYSGSSRTVDYSSRTCGSCAYEVYAEGDPDALLQAAEADLKKEAMENILEYFLENRYSFASMERILDLPQRTISKWKTGSSRPSAAAYTLFNMLRTFPWLLDIAEEKYDYDFSQKYFLKLITGKLIDGMSFPNPVQPVSPESAPCDDTVYCTAAPALQLEEGCCDFDTATAEPGDSCPKE